MGFIPKNRPIMKIIDLSAELSNGTKTYPGDPEVKTQKIKDVGRDGYALSKITMGLHSGTHVDAPAHYLNGGRTIDEISLGMLIGKARVCDLSSGPKKISEKELKKFRIRRNEIVLLKTRKGVLTADGADFLLQKKIRAVGIDGLSIEESGSSVVHKKLLSKNIPIMEGLVLKRVKPGTYQFICLPLKIRGGEAAPARCVLIGR